MAETKAQEPAGKKVIAEWVGDTGTPRIDGVSVRQITKKDAKSIEVDLTKDLVWNAGNRYRVDVTDAPKPLLDALKADRAFKFSEE